MSNTQNSLMLRLPNWVGDVIMSLPAIEALKASGIQVSLIGKPWIQDLLEGLEVPIVTLKSNVRETIRFLSDISEKSMLLFTNSLSSALIARLAGKAAIGYKTDFRSFLLTHSIAKKKHQHEVEYFWDIAHFAVEYWFPKIIWPLMIPTTITLPIASRHLDFADAILKEEQISKPFIVLCPFAHGTGKNNQPKIWPHWSLLSKALADKTLVVCPGKNELPLCKDLVPQAKILSGLNLAQYAAILSKSAQVIANDSGPMHLATAVNAPTLGIFGVSNPSRTHPWGGNYMGNENNWPTLDEVLNKLKY